MSRPVPIASLGNRRDARRATAHPLPLRPAMEAPLAVFPTVADATAALPVPRVGLEILLEHAAESTGHARLKIDCVLPAPSDEVLLRRLALELRAERPDPARLLRLALRMLEPDDHARQAAVVPAAELADADLSPPPSTALLEQLTPRERRVAMLAMEGLRNKEIARRLCRSVRTVECQISSALRKLRIASRVQLMRALQAEAAAPVASSVSRKARAALDSVRPACTT